ncbi:MAG: PEP-CTERM sorting domain-containing protein [Verrucomicrobiaceae bacterium]|nr:MAG: PEP-CTERM sorting domain-containing protein [Verrucomicrobiaceae bacterium]
MAFAANSGSTATYILGPGAGWGYAINSIVSLASWRDSALYQQTYQIWTRAVGGATFDLAYPVGNDLNPVADLNSGGSSKITVSDSNGGFVAYGIDAIRFVILDIPAGFEPNPGGGSTAFREIDVFGSAVIPEPGSTLMFLGATLAALGLRRRALS